ncbi:MAG: hypothetical protein WKF97_08435 [Chitinophagaceae bacterium]
MKKYYENWTNPKTQEAEQIEVQEYDFMDWWEGRISGPWQPGKHLVLNTTEQKYHYDLLKEEEWSKIEERRKAIYFDQVERLTEGFIHTFKKRYEISEAKDRLLQIEIERYEKLLFAEKLPISVRTNRHFPLDEIYLPSGEIPDFSKMIAKGVEGLNPDYKGETVQLFKPSKLNTIDICEIRDIYEKIIVNGIRDFAFTNSPNCQIKIGAGDSPFVRVESIAKYYNWLLDFKNKTPADTETTIPKPDEKLSEVGSSKNQSTGEVVGIKNNFDSVKIDKVYDHFSKHLVEKNYLTEAELTAYLKQALELKEPPKDRFSFKLVPTKAKIYKVFYRYFKDIAGKPYRRQREYAALLGDYFEGYDTDTVSTNWSK